MLPLALLLIPAADPAPVTVNGVKIHYTDRGTGDTVVLIHGLHSSAALNWDLPGIAAELAKKNRVLAIDMPGHGASDKPADGKHYGRQIAADVVAVLDAAKVKKAHVIGYSAGGLVALRTAVDYPDRVAALGLTGMGWLPDGSPIGKMWVFLPSGNGKTGPPPAFLKAVEKLGVTEKELKAVSCPTKIIVGADDPVKKLYVAPLKKARPDWPVLEIAGAGHLSCVAKPEFKAELVKWVGAK